MVKCIRRRASDLKNRHECISVSYNNFNSLCVGYFSLSILWFISDTTHHFSFSNSSVVRVHRIFVLASFLWSVCVCA